VERSPRAVRGESADRSTSAATATQAVLVDPDTTWPHQARRLIAHLRDTGGCSIIRVDHIGSTSVSGLPAKELIDIQVVVEDLATADRVARAARRAGFVHVPGPWFGTDRHGADHPEEVVIDADPGRPVNVNIRPVSAPIWRETLLFRDWLHAHGDERDGEHRPDGPVTNGDSRERGCVIARRNSRQARVYAGVDPVAGKPSCEQ
jgi:GrpB-like predicted nucleotidyltransferase (UPF0157 family)